MLISCTGVSFSFPDQSVPLFEGVTFTLPDDARLGVIGPNGSGKSTLLRLLTGELQPSAGIIMKRTPAPSARLVSLEPGDARTVMESALASLDPRLAATHVVLQSQGSDAAAAAAEFASLDGYAAAARVQRALTQAGLGKCMWAQATASLSVGERLWLRITEALLASSDLLLLDEPTSHLDIRWRADLAAMLQDLDTPYVVVSHDRHFLDLVCTEVLQLQRGTARLFAGGYSASRATLAAEEEHNRDVYAQQTRKVKQLTKAIGAVKAHADTIEAQAYRTSSAFFSHKAARMERRAAALRGQLERSLAEARAAKPFVEKQRRYALPTSQRTGVLVSLVRVSAGAGTRTLFRHLSLTVRAGEHWCILGPNGAGKSTLVEVLSGRRPPESGQRLLSPSVRIALVPQQGGLEHGDSLPVDLVCQAGGCSQQDARLVLGTLGIGEDLAFQRMGLLSAGQQKRVLIATLVAGKPDLLVIDELEGGLDLDAVTGVEQALCTFDGALVMVTHDTALAQSVGEHFMTLDGAGGWSMESPFGQASP